MGGVYSVSLWAADFGRTLGQVATDEKSKARFPRLLPSHWECGIGSAAIDCRFPFWIGSEFLNGTVNRWSSNNRNEGREPKAVMNPRTPNVAQVELPRQRGPAIPERWKLVEIQGAILTLDARGTQTAIAQDIVAGEADLGLALPGNPERLDTARG